MRKPRKPKPFRAAKEVKRLARITVGAPPPEQVEPPVKHKPPKHKKKAMESEAV